MDYAVDIVDLSKSFRRKTVGKGYTTIKSSLLSFFRSKSKREPNTTSVLRDLTMRIPRGASLGVIGRNGSGKSTLLKLITGIYKADKGKISVNGRIAALIELGAGFHPDFSGRENLYLGGVLHGLSKKEIDKKFADIVKFAELEDVIDDPVRTYSSGMFMRLGFSLAVHTDPDVLIVDEVLAVGDARFVAKCKDKINDLRREGKTLILVTHDLDAVRRWCDEALWLHDGEVKDRGDPLRVIDHYLQFIEKGEELELLEANKNESIAAATSIDGHGLASLDEEQSSTSAYSIEKQRWGSREIELTGIRMMSSGTEKLLLHPEDPVTIEIGYRANDSEGAQRSGAVVFGIGIHRADGLSVHGSNTHIERVEVPKLTGEGTIRYTVKRISLLEGRYLLDVAVHREDGYPFDYHKNAVSFSVRSHFAQVGVFEPEHSWEFLK